MPRLVLPFIMTTTGRSNCRCRTQPCSSTAGCSVKPLPIDETFARIGIHREVADLKCGEVLEEVAALRRSHAEIAKPRFDDDARARDLVPRHRNAEPRIGRSPAADADQQIRACFRSLSLALKCATLLRDFVTPRRSKRCEVDDDDVAQSCTRPCPRTCALWQTRRLGPHLQTNLFAFARQHQRPQLQEAKVGSLAFGSAAAGPRTRFLPAAQRVFTDRHQVIENLRQRESVRASGWARS